MEQWLTDNVTVVVGGVAVSAILTFLYTWFTTKTLPKIVLQIKTFLVTYIGNMLGMSFEDSEDLVEALPFVKQMENQTSQLAIGNEEKLIELKRKILSPLYDDEDTAILIKQFDNLVNKMDGAITDGTAEILQDLEDLYNKKEGE